MAVQSVSQEGDGSTTGWGARLVRVIRKSDVQVERSMNWWPLGPGIGALRKKGELSFGFLVNMNLATSGELAAVVDIGG